MTEKVRVPGARDVRGTIDGGDADAVVVACPPDPRQRGHRGDPRLTAVGDALVDRGVDCLRIDYGDWDEGYGECEDARNAVRFAADRYDRVGLFGYSFGGAVALIAAGTVSTPVFAVSTLAPADRLADDLDAAAAVDDVDAPVQVIYGSRDDVIDAERVAERVRARGGSVEELSADHFYVGKHDRVGAMAATFLAGHAGE